MVFLQQRHLPIFGIDFALRWRYVIFTAISIHPAQKPSHIKMDFSYTDILVGDCVGVYLYLS